MTYLWHISFLVISVAVTAGALQCYQCVSHDNDGCFPLDKSRVSPTPCPLDSVSCITLRQESKFKLVFNNQPEPQVRYLRGCSSEPSKTENFCVDRAGTGAGTKNRFCSCITDGCNHATHSAKLGLLSIISLPIVMLLSQQ